MKSPGPTCRVSSPTRNSPSPSITITIRLGVKFAAFSRAGRDVGGNELAITDEHALDRVIFCRCIRLKRLDQIGQIHEVRHHSLFLSATAMP